MSVLSPLFSRKYIAMAVRKTWQDDRDLSIRWYHIMLEKMTIGIYWLFYPLARIPLVNGVWETFIRSYYQGIGGFLMRAAFYRTRFRKMGVDVFINVGVLIWKPDRIEIGNNVHINTYCTLIGHSSALIKVGNNVHISHYSLLNGRGGIEIKDNTGLSPYVTLFSGAHYHRLPNGDRAAQCNMVSIKEQNIVEAPIIIGPNATVRWNSLILPGVIIGEWAVVGANSMVKEFVPDEAIVVGSPAKIKAWNREHKVERVGDYGSSLYI